MVLTQKYMYLVASWHQRNDHLTACTELSSYINRIPNSKYCFCLKTIRHTHTHRLALTLCDRYRGVAGRQAGGWAGERAFPQSRLLGSCLRGTRRPGPESTATPRQQGHRCNCASQTQTPDTTRGGAEGAHAPTCK